MAIIFLLLVICNNIVAQHYRKTQEPIGSNARAETRLLVTLPAWVTPDLMMHTPPRSHYQRVQAIVTP
jgi:hypothetical protein